MQLAVFASGGGSNFQAITEAAQDGSLEADVALCVSDRKSPGVKQRAKKLGVPFISLYPYSDCLSNPGAIDKLLHQYDVSHIALAGFLRKIPELVVREYRHQITNIHPALLPSFGGQGMYGLKVHQAVIERGVQWTGVTVHLVDETYDTGPILLQHPVPVRHGDTPETLASRVLDFEHKIYPAALQLLAEKRVSVDNGRVLTEGPRPTFSLSY